MGADGDHGRDRQDQEQHRLHPGIVKEKRNEEALGVAEALEVVPDFFQLLEAFAGEAFQRFDPCIRRQAAERYPCEAEPPKAYHHESEPDGIALFGEAQLLVVSHQKRTMEAADVLYGVSMPPGGSSRVVSQRIRDLELEDA